METIKLWNDVPGLCEVEPILEYYPAKEKKTDATIVILPGGGYYLLAKHEGKGYANFFASLGMDTFVCRYRVKPHTFPLPLLDARRAIRYIRANAEKYQIDPQKIGIMGSSAGGHLAAAVSTYFAPIDGEDENDPMDKIDCIPNLTILCYPVIAMSDLSIVDLGSVEKLLGNNLKLATIMDPSKQVSQRTPEAFVWHTSDDSVVDVENSMRYVLALHKEKIKAEYHVFPSGKHGLGLANMEGKNNPYVSKWAEMLKQWLIMQNWL